ncbi:MAG: ABC transporter substrate-binding protein [Nitrosopumilaceae archaeon]|nr:ABC transporter substrate-binding protein [Nitrosopumilaceae archaeon]
MHVVPLLVAALLAVSAGSAWGLETAGDDARAAGTPEHGDVRIGVVAPTSGGASGYGMDIMAASRLAVADFNEHLAERGAAWRLVPVYVDSLTDPGAVMPALEYLDALGVRVVAGPSIDLFGAEVSEFSSDRGMLLLSCCSVTLESAIPGDNLYRMTPNQTNHGIILADVMYEGGKTLVVPVGRNSAWVTDLLESAVERFAARGGEATDVVVYDTYGEFDEGLARMNGMVTEAGDALGYDRVAVLYVGFEETFELIRDAAGYGGLAAVQWFGADANTLLHDHPLDAAAATDFTVAQPVSLGGQRSAALGERLAWDLGRPPSVYAYQQYDAVWLLGMAVLESGRTDAYTLKAYLDGRTHTGVGEAITFDGYGDRDSAAYGIWHIRDGAWALEGIVDSAHGQLHCLDTVNGRPHITLEYLQHLFGQADPPDPKTCGTPAVR